MYDGDTMTGTKEEEAVTSEATGSVAPTSGEPVSDERISEERCHVVEPGIVLIRESPRPTADGYAALLARARELGAEFEQFVLVLDLSDLAIAPKGAYVQAVRHSLEGAFYLAVTRPQNRLIRLAAGFMISRMMPHASMHATLAEALEVARNYLSKCR